MQAKLRNRWRRAKGRLRIAARNRLGPHGWLIDGNASGSVLSLDPPIVYTTLTWPDTTRYLWAFGARFARKPALVLVYFSWHFDGEGGSREGLRQLGAYRRSFPKHRVQFVCNAPDELEALRRNGEDAALLNHNLTVSETFFRPLDDAERIFDAVYNARLDAGKRIHLAAEIERVAYITRTIPNDDASDAKRIYESIRRLEPLHVIANRTEDRGMISLDAEGVNRAYNRASVGLCLSEIEGAMLSSMEYMLAGLPIVSTPSVGGRDFFFDPDYCLIAKPDPRDIRDAVAALKARAVPPDYIRERTLRRLEAQRADFLALLDDFLEESGYRRRFAGAWPWLHRRNFCLWGAVEDHVARARAEATAFPG